MLFYDPSHENEMFAYDINILLHLIVHGLTCQAVSGNKNIQLSMAQSDNCHEPFSTLVIELNEACLKLTVDLQLL